MSAKSEELTIILQTVMRIVYLKAFLTLRIHLAEMVPWIIRMTVKMIQRQMMNLMWRIIMPWRIWKVPLSWRYMPHHVSMD
jgi:hypothetical protein